MINSVRHSTGIVNSMSFQILHSIWDSSYSIQFCSEVYIPLHTCVALLLRISNVTDACIIVCAGMYISSPGYVLIYQILSGRLCEDLFVTPNELLKSSHSNAGLYHIAEVIPYEQDIHKKRPL